MSGFELRLLYLLNHLAGRSAELDSVLRILAVGAALGGMEVARPYFAAEEPGKCLRITRDAALSGGVAFVLCVYLSHIRPRVRPFLSMPLVMLYVPPNNLSFPDPVVALGVGITMGAIHKQRGRWAPAGIVTALWVLARMTSGTMLPFDALAGVGLGMLPAAAEAGLARVPAPRWVGRAGALVLAIVMVGVLRVALRSKPKLPPQSTSQETMGAVRSKGPIAAVPDDRMKGYGPVEEARLLEVADSVFPPLPVERVEVVSDGAIQVAGVKLSAGEHWDATSRVVTEWNAARALKAMLAGRPEIDEIDLWADVPFVAHGGKMGLRSVLFVEARRKKAARLMAASEASLLLDSRPLLSTLGAGFALSHDFPVPGQSLPNGAAEGSG